MTYDARAAGHASGMFKDRCGHVHDDATCSKMANTLMGAYEAGQASRDAELAGVRAEVERLRAALQEIADAPDDTHEVDPNGEHYHDCGPCRAIEALATPPTTGKP